MVIDENAIKRAVRAVEAAYGGAFIPRHAVISAATENTLKVLAALAGVEHPGLAAIADLVALYSVARKSPASAANVAKRINDRVTADTVPAWREAPVMPAPAPAPAPGLNEFRIKEIVADMTREHVTRDNFADWATETVASMHDEYRAVRQLIPTMDQVQDMVTAAYKAITPTSLTIEAAGAPAIPLGLVHYKTESVIKALAAGVNVYLHGPAGSGKTTIAQKAAEAFKVPFYFAAKVESEYLLLGFKDAHGNAVRTQFRDAYENGGVFLFDEMDASAPAAIVALNAALANGVCPFPDGIIPRHADFKCIGAGNTVLSGANRQYVGRVQLDAASVDRFAFIELPYDETLEAALSTNAAWTMHVQAIRKAVADRGIPHLVSPRATYDGCKLLDAGFPWNEVEDMSIFKGLDTETANQLRRAASSIL